MLLSLSTAEMAYFCLFIVSFIFLLKQAFVKNKQQVHFLFAIFCASLCMMCVQKLTASNIGIYQYVIGFAACATCNMVWLISRALFREKNAVTTRHIFVAALIALLIIANQTWHIVNESEVSGLLPQTLMYQLKLGLSETTNLLSSAILMLSFWESLRGLSAKTSQQKIPHIIFASAFFIAVFSSTVISKVFVSPSNQAAISPWIVFYSATLIILAIEVVILLKAKLVSENSAKSLDDRKDSNLCFNEHDNQHIILSEEDKILTASIENLMVKQKIYLQGNIKLVDFATALDEPEYKISRLIRGHFNSPNFNHFINRYRVEYAKELLKSKQAEEWSILVIALESGFSSLVSFNRAFKNLVGEKPSLYRASDAVS